MDGLGGLSKALVIVATLALAGIASYEIRSHRGGASPIAPASAVEPATGPAPQAEPPSNEIRDFQQLD